ncbi:IclR family transcriptional regulator [Aeromicrobium phragmitis]|uniref:IclR family transcriptional regulator n=1 Tax=Aeromicrobium phragmitis TaxID=2478914 RepID=A0A3L8PP11_9ACTN|nr:IclR family transcriptional regulator [Aeromicrobium phragmitis]RLV57136.1 IclR family transcriptional regulator [Aeromicrobium phragmitis]
MTDTARAPRVGGDGTVARAMRLLSAVVDAEGPASVNALADASALPASTTHRLLGLLVDVGMVTHDPQLRSYSVGPETYRLAARTLQTVDLPGILQPVLDRLAGTFGETVIFGLYSPATSTLSFAGRADGDHVLQYRIELNTPTSVLWGASGKAVAAFLPDEELAAAYERESRGTGGGRSNGGSELPALERLREDLAVVREQGYVESQGEKLPGARGIAVPVVGPRGVVGSLTLTHPQNRAPAGDAESIVAALQDGAEEIARYFGATGKAVSR